MPNTCIGDELKGDIDVYDKDGKWTTAWTGCAACFADYLVEDWGDEMNWRFWRWRYGDPATHPQPGDEDFEPGNYDPPPYWPGSEPEDPPTEP